MNIPKIFQEDTFIVNEKVAVLKFANNYQIYGKDGQEIGKVQQIVPGWAKVLRLMSNMKSMLPFELNILDENEMVQAEIKRGFTWFFSRVNVFDHNKKLIGTFQAKFKMLGSRFEILDEHGQKVGEINGDWKGWDFKITNNQGMQIGTVNKKWSGAVREMFTSADKYMVNIDPSVAEDENKILILAVAICMDMILKESK